MSALRPPALDLPQASMVRWNSFTRVIMRPEETWPRALLQRPIIVGRIGQRTMALIADPEAAKAVLTAAPERFPKWRIYQHVVGRASGHESLVAATGDRWRRQRRIFSPMFRPEALAHLPALFRRATEAAIESWTEQAEPIRLDASLAMTQLTLDIIWQVLFGAGDLSRAPPSVAATALRVHAAQLQGEVNTPPRIIAEFAEAVVRNAPAPGALPGNPFAARGSPAQPLSRQELHDNVRSFLSAGHETTALTLMWALWLIAQDVETQARLHDEIERVVGAGPVDDAHIERLVFAGQVVNETLRLFPSAVVTVRQTREPIVLAGEALPAGAVLCVCIYALQRHRDWWTEPDVFRPDRFSSGEPRHRYAYLPFSAGPHTCIGATFAWKEIITILATILQRFRVTTDAPALLKPRVLITLRPDGEVPITLWPRHAAD
jgi:cytochrome P450